MGVDEMENEKDIANAKAKLDAFTEFIKSHLSTNPDLQKQLGITQ